MIRKSPRAICLEILSQVNRKDRSLDVLLDRAFKKYRHLTPLDRAFLTELAYGILRWRERLDWPVRHLSKVPFEKIEPETLNLLRLGLYQIDFLTRTPVSAAVNESVGLGRRYHGGRTAGFVNAILRNYLRKRQEIRYPLLEEDPALHLSVVHSHPRWLVERWIRELGLETALALCRFNNRIAPLTLRVNTLRVKREELIERLRAKGLKAIPNEYSSEGISIEDPPPVSELPFLREGLFVLQDEASQLVTSVLDPRPGEAILDGCASPGGKTTHLAQRMGNRGVIYAVDLSQKKLAPIEENCRRLGVAIVKTLKGDVTRPHPQLETMTFDRVLADVPCTGFGTLRRNPDLKWKKTERDVHRLSQLQFSILSSLSRYVKPGGILVYSTCTVFREENEGVVERFLQAHPEFRLESVMPYLPEKCHPFVQGGVLKTFPPRNGMDGFFVARLARLG
ncbi:MAG: 16S rRNA (cytosine(967)-C(5))-methyltransferase RsmB [Desulfobacterota bacterium]|nr:16S rRNA (cytosine(967)-C(5))-methyltransferase RsmB [Thermodesulfobacteriota bacterium]